MKDSVFTFTIAVLFITLTIMFYGVFYGWLDDTILANYLQGVFLGEPISEFFTAHIFISKIYHFFYQNFVLIGWYGVFLIIFNGLAVFNVFYVIYKKWQSLHKSNFYIIFLTCLIVYILILVENLVLLNYSKTALLLLGSSLLLLDFFAYSNFRSKIHFIWYVYLMMSILIGLFLRYDIAIFIIIPLTFFLVRNFNNKFYLIKVITFSIVVGFLFFLTMNLSLVSDVKEKNKVISHILNITDGKNTINDFFIDLANKDIEYKALALSYLPDTKFYNSESLDIWGQRSILSIESLKFFYSKLVFELNKANSSYSSDYLESENWLQPFVFFLLFNFAIFIFSIIYSKNKHHLFFHVLILSSYYLGIVIVMVFFKMEGRVAMPSSAIITLASFSLFVENNSGIVYRLRKYLFIFLVVISIFKLQSLSKLSEKKQNELVLQSNFVKELNHVFNNKLIFFDIWTMSLFSNDPLLVTPRNTSNKYLTHKECWSGFIDNHVKYIDNLCGGSDFVSFYSCMYNKKNQVVFVYTKDARIGLIEEYAKRIHNYNLEFSEIFANSELSKIKYAYLPNKLDFGYFIITKFENCKEN
jgi:hypothetical protein